jgi:biopolymer transport protein ExbD/biopolymer transport protein TolR
MGQAKRTTSVVNDINVTPMVDVMLVLLIIFMVVTPMLQHGVSVDMAKTHNPRNMQDADKEDAVLIAVTRDGRVYLGSNQVPASELAPKVKDLIAARADKTVYVKSDARAKFKDVVDVVDNVRAAGVSDLGLLTDKIEDSGAAPAKPSGSDKK